MLLPGCEKGKNSFFFSMDSAHCFLRVILLIFFQRIFQRVLQRK